jgi:hypothetical protein
MESAPALKHCPCCHTSKEQEKFSPDRRNKDGLAYRCKSCSAAYFRTKYRINPEPFKRASQKYKDSLRDYQA